MKWFAGLRALVLLRRGVRALESLANSLEYFVNADRMRVEAELGHRWRRGAKVTTELGTLDVKAANKSWHDERAAALVDDEDPY